MDTDRFDALTRTMGHGTSRRAALKGLLGLGAASVGAVRLTAGADAARRGFSGPKLPAPTPTPGPDPCECDPNQECIGGLCFLFCTGCPCDSCTLVPDVGSFCTQDAYATSGSCEGICEAGYACDGGSICMQPCHL